MDMDLPAAVVVDGMPAPKLCDWPTRHRLWYSDSMATTSDLSPNPRNPRKITDKRLAQLKRSLTEFGDLSGVVFNRRGGRLVSGHQRAAAWDLGTPGSIEYTQRFDTPTNTGTVALGRITVNGETFAYREVEWDEAREKAANLAANRAAGEWDTEALGGWAKELNEAHFDLDLTMFNENEIDRLLKGATDPLSPDTTDLDSKSDDRRAREIAEVDDVAPPADPP